MIDNTCPKETREFVVRYTALVTMTKTVQVDKEEEITNELLKEDNDYEIVDYEIEDIERIDEV